jgi:hypothetical protein
MSRYTAAEVIQLPRLTAAGAMALGVQLAAAAKPVKKELSKGIARVLGALAASQAALSEALCDQVTPDTEESADTVQLDRILDGCWSGLNDFLTAFTKLPPGSPEVGEATALQAAILAGGLKFILLTYVLEWSESEVRLQRIKKNGFDVRVKALGGQVFLDALTKAHQDYGKALGMTTPVATPTETPPSIREALDTFAETLREYIVKVMGSVEPDEPETRALADKLLAPLAAWNVRPIAKGTAGPGAQPGEPDPIAGSPPPADG